MEHATNLGAIERSIAALAGHGVVPAVASTLDSGAEAAARAALARIVDEVEAFSSSANPDILPQLQTHIEALVGEIRRLAGGAPAGDFAFVRDHARERAQQRFPLEALLHSYRCSHRVFAPWIRDAALAVADPAAQVRRVVAAAGDFAIDFSDAISTLATSEYVVQTRLLAEAEGDLRTELLNMLLDGYDESDSRAAQLLRRAGYLEQRLSFCVAVARSVNPGEMESPARAQRMAEAIAQTLRDAPVRSLVGVKHGLVTIVMSGSRRLSGWTAPQSLLAERVLPQLQKVGPAALIGLSNDAPSTSHIRRASNEARLALDFSDVSNRVMPYARIPFRQLVVRHAGDRILSAFPAWLERLRSADRKARGALSSTLRGYADADMNALRAAKALAVHSNTIYSRLQKIADLTGKNALRYHDLTELLLVLECSSERDGAEPRATTRRQNR